MTIAFKCSGCDNQFRVADTMAGRKGKCPKCGVINLIPHPAQQIRTRPAAAPPPLPGPAARPSRAPTKAPARDFDFDEERDERDDRDDRDGRDDVDDDDRPSRRRKGKKGKKGFPFLLVGLICGALLVLVGLGVGAYFLFSSSSGIGDDLKYVPDNSQVIASVRVDELMASDAWKQLKGAIPGNQFNEKDLEKEMGIATDNIERITVGANLAAKDEPVMIVRTKNAVTAAALKEKMTRGNKFNAAKVKSYEVYEEDRDAFCVADKKVVLYGPKGSVRAVLERGKKATLSAGLEAAMKQADFSKTMAVAVNVKDLPKGNAKGGVPGLDMLGGGADQVLNSIEGAAVTIKIAGDATLNAVILCKDNKSATELKKTVDQTLATVKTLGFLPKEAADALDLPLKVEGNNVTLNKTFKLDPLIKAAKDAAGKGPQGFPPEGDVVPKGPPQGGNPKGPPQGGNPKGPPQGGGNPKRPPRGVPPQK